MISLMRLGIGHAGYAAFGADHRGHALQGHHGNGAGLLGNFRLLDVHHVHDDAALEHLGQADLQTQACAAVGIIAVFRCVICHDGPPV